MALLEEAQWQDRSSHVLARLAAKYPGLEDVWHGPARALYEAKFGLRQLATGARLAREDTALLTQLLRFPVTIADVLPLLQVLLYFSP